MKEVQGNIARMLTPILLDEANCVHKTKALCKYTYTLKTHILCSKFTVAFNNAFVLCQAESVEMYDPLLIL